MKNNSKAIAETVSNDSFSVRYCFQNDKPYFMASDVIKCLGGYSCPQVLVKYRVAPEDVMKKSVYLGQGGCRKVLFIDEKGVYDIAQHKGFSKEDTKEFFIWFKDIPKKLTDEKPKAEAEAEEQTDEKEIEPVIKNISATPFDAQMMQIGIAWGNFILDTLKCQRAAVTTKEELEIALRATEMLLKNY